MLLAASGLAVTGPFIAVLVFALAAILVAHYRRADPGEEVAHFADWREFETSDEPFLDDNFEIKRNDPTAA